MSLDPAGTDSLTGPGVPLTPSDGRSLKTHENVLSSQIFHSSMFFI